MGIEFPEPILAITERVPDPELAGLPQFRIHMQGIPPLLIRQVSRETQAGGGGALQGDEVGHAGPFTLIVMAVGPGFLSSVHRNVFIGH